MNEHYLFSDESTSYRRPQQPAPGDNVEIRFQTALGDKVTVYLVHDHLRHPMTILEPVGDLQMYSITIPAPKKEFRYYFEVVEYITGPGTGAKPTESATTKSTAANSESPVSATTKSTAANSESPVSTITDSTASDSEPPVSTVTIYTVTGPMDAAGAIPKNAKGNFITRHSVFYNKMGVTATPNPIDDFVIRPGYIVPEWLPGSVIYQIFTDRFYNGTRKNDVKTREYIYLNQQPVEHVDDWSSLPTTLDVGRFYGGDLVGVWKKLDYLQNLGVEVIYLNPIFVSPSNHKYDTQDYDTVDPHLTIFAREEGECLAEGATDNADASLYRSRVTDPENMEASNQYFAEFVRAVHRRGMRIILDGVFNHCGSFNKWMDREGLYNRPDTPESEKGAWQSRDSRYRNYFRFDDDTNYESWWDLPTLPKLNYEESKALQEEILRIAVKWVSPPYNVDGWRLDVAADLGHSETFNHEFWQKFRKAVKGANPDAVILAEHYGDVTPWLSGGEWDTVMNYDAFMEPVSWFLTGMEKHSDSYNPDLIGDADTFWINMKKHGRAFGSASLHGAMNQLDNHDHSRFLTRTNHRVGRLATAGSAAAEEGVSKAILRQAVVMQMTWPGSPTLYYGDETGLCGWTDPDNRRSFPWGREDWDLIDFYKYAISIHKQHPALLTGSLIPLLTKKNVLAYGRCLRYDRIVVIINTSTEEQTANVDTKPLGIAGNANFWRLMITTETTYNVGLKLVESTDAQLDLTMPPVSAVILWEK